jgi:hypothetical protein
MYHFNTLHRLDATQFCLLALHSTNPQYMNCRGHVILRINNNLSTVAVFSYIEKPLELHGTVVYCMAPLFCYMTC